MVNELAHGTVGVSMTQGEFEAVGLHVLNSQATGDVIYASSATQLSRLGIGSTNSVLQTVGGIPAWVTNPTIAAPTFGTSITGSYLTASEILITDASKNVVSAAVATYPSLTELSYVKGLSSAIQTQLNGKAATLAGTINEITYFNSASTIASLAVATYPSLTELSYVKGVTSALQTQLGLKAPLASPTFTGTVTLSDVTLGGVLTANNYIQMSGNPIVGISSIDSNVSTDSTSNVDKIQISGFDLSAGNRSLAIGTEHAVAVSAATASTHKVGVRWNGATYYFLLTNV